MSLIEELRKCRVIDLTQKIIPGKAKGPLDTGRRKMEIKPFHYPPGELMHKIQMESHIGTHVEAPSHWVTVKYNREGKDISQLDVDTFIGESIFIDLSKFDKKQSIEPEHFEDAGVAAGYIVIIGNSLHSGKDRPFMSYEAARWLADNRVKVVGFDDTIYPEDPKVGTDNLELYHTHDFLLSNDIPIIEGLINLSQIDNKKFFIIGTLIPVVGLEAFPIRVMALV
ncbi:MAG: cyclase family protein [Spirochaetota bacterium]|nr:MAG: cyclase family protein [Spirochaetota bacterium]